MALWRPGLRGPLAARPLPAALHLAYRRGLLVLRAAVSKAGLAGHPARVLVQRRGKAVRQKRGTDWAETLLVIAFSLSISAAAMWLLFEAWVALYAATLELITYRR